MSDIRDVLTAAVTEAGRAILGHVGTRSVTEKEGNNNFVTAADYASETVIVDRIRAAFPDHQILSEESSPHLEQAAGIDHLWIADPLDGTTNFRFGRAYSCVSLAYAERGELVAGAVYDFYRDELFLAEAGKGATLNGEPIRVGTQANLEKANLATDGSYDPEGTRRNLELCLRLRPLPWMLLRGSAALTMAEIACGRMDLYLQTALKPWDNAAACLLIREAGGVIVDLEGKPVDFFSPVVVAGNPALTEQFVRAIAR